MDRIKSALLLLLCLSISSIAFGQAGTIFFIYSDGGVQPPVDPPLTTTCGGTTPIPDATQIVVFWDRNGNGPDETDVTPDVGEEYGNVNWNTAPFNGNVEMGTPGYFWTDPSFEVRVVPSDPDVAAYYLRVNTGEACWYSASYTVTAGSQQDVVIPFADWNCVAGPCPTVGNPPNAPTGVAASDDEFCLSVHVSWMHDGLLNPTGFNIYANGVFVRNVNATVDEADIAVRTDQVQVYTVVAANAAGFSAHSIADAGSAYVIRFAPGPTGDLTGDSLAGTTHSIDFISPPLCPSGVMLYFLDSLNVRRELLASCSLCTSLEFTLPNDLTRFGCRLLMVDSSFDAGVVFTDTTESEFDLGYPDAIGDPGHWLTPDRFELAQNFPNPFNPTTTVMFSVPQQAVVQLKIYNIMGQHVRTLASGAFPVGVHSVMWDGLSDSGLAVGAGVYLCRMEGPGFNQTTKMLLMK